MIKDDALTTISFNIRKAFLDAGMLVPPVKVKLKEAEFRQFLHSAIGATGYAPDIDPNNVGEFKFMGITYTK